MRSSININSLYVVGLAHRYPPYTHEPDEFDDLVKRLYPQHATLGGLKKLMAMNRRTGIKSRGIAFDTSNWTKEDATPPSIHTLSQTFRAVGVDLAVATCIEAIQEAQVSAADVTHVVAVTCTDQGNPGYDLHVCQKLGLRSDVQRTLLHGVGCAGGLSALRTGANLAAAESQKRRPARVLVMACEICTLFLRAELLAASQDDALHIAPALFSDGAAALVVCNGLALRKDQHPIFELQEWGSMSVPATISHMSYMVKKNAGLIATLTKDVPSTAVSAILPMLATLRNATQTPQEKLSWSKLGATEFDWAIHPGGAAILTGSQKALGLTDEHMRASLEVYNNYGNSSSPSVLIVLDKLRHMGKGRDYVVSTSFGPGMIIEMCILERCCAQGTPPLRSSMRWQAHPWLWLQSRLMRLMREYEMTHRISGKKHRHGIVER
ncbi:thiolase-like protein [Setomelanomma holmii]|uniref:Thiolase-like protein n=1 Tax=Setomelanomma holmii TaxID=210430 RepID=A0A9P4GV80_9PLEO|nr:thiolase-like protein [Setomelanomma holmii]